MLVSAIPTVQKHKQRASIQKNSSAFSFSAADSSVKKNPIKDSTQNIFDSINEWKNFCNKQIAAGKFDIIA